MNDHVPVALFRADQCRRWRSGERVGVEFYLDQHPALRDDPEAVLDLIVNEVVLREGAGESPGLDEFLGRFPWLDDPIRLQFEVHEALGPGFPPSIDAAGASTLVRPFGSVEGGEVEVPGYRIIAELGRGGMGVVYLAEQLALNRRVALKMILAGLHAGPEVLARFRTEAELVARLQHPHVVQIHEVGERGGCPYFCLEFVDGGNLEAHLSGTPRPGREAARLAETLARTMHHVHGHGILHRDLKPSNILLTSGGVPKITDFGLAKLMKAAGPGQTPSEAFLGTPSYMAPEQAEGRTRAVGVRSDVYALGAILYELLTGHPPFRASTALDTMMLVVCREPVPPSRLQPRVARDLETICLKCLDKDPGRRYPDAGELADDLARFLDGEPIRARPVTPWRRASKWAGRRPLTASLLGVSVAAVLALVAFGGWVELAARRRVAENRAIGRQSSFQAEVAMSSGDWPSAKVHLTRALTSLGREPSLADETSQAGRQLAEVERRLAEQAARRDALSRLARFERGRDEVIFLSTRSLDADSAEIRDAAFRAAREAFASVGLALDGDRPLSPGPPFLPEERRSIASGGYELLLILADALAQPLSTRMPEDPRRQVAEALRVLDRAAGLGPPTRAYHRLRSRCLASLGDEAAALEQARRAGELPGDGPGDSFLAGVDLFIGGQGLTDRRGWAEAIRCFEKTLRSQPDHFWARYDLAVCSINVDRPDLATAYLTACLAQRPDFVWIFLLRGFASGELRHFDAAEADFRRAEALGPDPDARYALLVNRASARLAEGRRDEAEADLRRAITQKPDRYRAYVNLALLHKGDRRYAEAAGDLDAALRLGPPELVRSTLRTEQAHLLLLMGKFSEALDACNALARGGPGPVDALGVRGLALLKLGKEAESAASFSDYLDRGGRPRPDIHLGRGQARMALGEFPGAVEDFTRALEFGPDRETRTLRGWAYFFAEAHRLALLDFEAALKLDASAVDALIGRGLSRVALGQDARAVEDAEEALRTPSLGPEMLLNVACIFGRAAGRDDPGGRLGLEAVRTLRRALDRLPTADRPSFWREKVQPDPYLESLRRNPEFLELGRPSCEARPGSPL